MPARVSLGGANKRAMSASAHQTCARRWPTSAMALADPFAVTAIRSLGIFLALAHARQRK
jgi:hypothetical protein